MSGFVWPWQPNREAIEEDLELLEIALDDPQSTEMMIDTPFPTIPVTPLEDEETTG